MIWDTNLGTGGTDFPSPGFPLQPNPHQLAVYRCPHGSQAGLFLSASYTYDNDLLTKIETGSTTYSFSYGNFSLRSSIQVGSRTLATYYYHDETEDDHKNDLDRLAYGNDDMIQYEYDQQGRVTKQTYEDGDTVTYQYDNSGALATVSDSATGRKTTYYYDFTDRLMKYVESGTGYSHSVGYAYDTLNNLTSLVETINGVEHTTSYAYDKDNRVSSVTTDGITVEYSYDAYGRVIQQKTKNGSTVIMTETFTYVNPSSITTSSQIATHKTETANYSITYTYTYDKNGNILSVSDGTNTTSYVYDSANQLIRENHQRRNETYVWTYDDAGNILSRETYTYTSGDLDTAATASSASTYSLPNSVEEMTPLGEEPTQQSNHMSTEQMSASAMATSTATATNTYTYGDTDWGDLLTAYNGAEITYDGIGNPLSDGTRTFTWEHGRQMASMTKNNSTWTYTYNSDGLRTSRTNGVTTYDYVYSGDLLKQMTVTDVASGAKQVLTFTYDATGTPLTLDLDGTVYYYLTNIQGDVTGIVDADGNILIQYVYEGYGKSYFINDTSDLTVTLGSINPLAYRAYVFDMGTALYYLQSRYYDQFLGRFLNADRAISGTGGELLGYNQFAYCFNNPVNLTDSVGNWPNWGKLFNGASLLAVGLVACAAAATVVSGGACTPLLVAACVTFTAGGITALNGTAEMVESVTDHNFMRDDVYGGDEKYYETQKTVFETTAKVGTAFLGAVSGSPDLCFVAGTMVLASQCAKAIEAIVAGDYVWAWDEKTGEIALKQVVETYVNETSELVHVFVNGEEIITTPSHPFYSPVKGWTDAVHLRAGDILVLVNGEYVVVERIQHEILESPITVYNFQVADYHTYYVTNSGVLVHNKCGGETPATQRGRQTHKEWDYGPGVEKEQTIAPGARVDGIDWINHIVYELKPNNPRAITRGLKQLERYLTILGEADWAGILVLYD